MYFLREYSIMKKLILTLTILTITFGLYARPLFAQYENTLKEVDAPIIVELFTSQGCSSCPAADRILSELAKNENVITLGCHVSYWNHLQWKDTLSHDFCDVRQHGIQGLRGERKIYTPQMVINGEYVFVGSNAAKLSFALNKAQDTKLLHIKTEKEGANLIKITLPDADKGDYRLWGFGYKNKVTTNIGRGENSGRIIDYTSPVMSYHNLGPWDGTTNSLSFEKPDGDIDGIAIFAQKDAYGKIIAAGKHPLR